MFHIKYLCGSSNVDVRKIKSRKRMLWFTRQGSKKFGWKCCGESRY